MTYGRRDSELEGLRGTLNAFQEQYGRIIQLAVAVWLIFVSVGLLCLAILFYVSERQDGADNRRAARQARVSCERARTFGPALLVAYRRYHILNEKQLRAYGAGLPKTCK